MEKLTAQEYRNLAAGSRSAKEESFDRCDTDGFLSQWAHGLHSQLYSRLAELAENNWESDFPALFYAGTNDRVPAKIIYVRDKFSYNGGMKALWAIVDPSTGKFTGQFLPTGKNSRKQKSAGVWEGTEIAPAYAKIDGRGTGLSGSAWVSVYRTDGGMPPSCLNVKTDSEAREETVARMVKYCEENFAPAPHVSERTSSKGKEYTAIVTSANRGNIGSDIAIHVYGPGFILVKISGYNVTAGMVPFYSFEEATHYMDYAFGKIHA